MLRPYESAVTCCEPIAWSKNPDYVIVYTYLMSRPYHVSLARYFAFASAVAAIIASAVASIVAAGVMSSVMVSPSVV